MGLEVGDDVGLEVGEEVGDDVGLEVGKEVGSELGRGDKLGLKVGEEVGFEVGDDVGLEVGLDVGDDVGGVVDAATMVVGKVQTLEFSSITYPSKHRSHDLAQLISSHVSIPSAIPSPHTDFLVTKTIIVASSDLSYWFETVYSIAT